MHILISFGNPKTGSSLLRLARDLTYKFNTAVKYTALHVTPSSELNQLDAVLYEKESFKPIRHIAQLENIPLHTIYKNSNEVEKEMKKAMHLNNYDLLLLGAANPLFTDDKTGGILENFLEQDEVNVAVLVDKGYQSPKQILWIVFNDADKSMFEYCDRFVNNNQAHIDILCFGDDESSQLIFHNLHKNDYYLIKNDHQQLSGLKKLNQHFLSKYDLIVVKLETWKKLTKNTEVNCFPSTLIIKHNKELPLNFNSGNTKASVLKK